MLNNEELEFITKYHLHNGTKLESFVRNIQDAIQDGVSIISKNEYKLAINALAKLKPSSKLIVRKLKREEYELEDFDENVYTYSFCSVQKDIKLKKALINKECIIGLNAVGYPVRLVYLNGDLITATAGFHRLKGREIKDCIVKSINTLSKIDTLGNIPLVEIRGKIVQNKEINSSLMGIVQGIYSGYISKAEFIADDILSSHLNFKNIKDSYDFIESIGLNVPTYTVSDANDIKLTGLADKFSGLDTNYEFKTDGLFLRVNSNKTFIQIALENKKLDGQMILQVGKWDTRVYKTKVLDSRVVRDNEYIKYEIDIEPLKINKEIMVKSMVVNGLNVALLQKVYKDNYIYIKIENKKPIITDYDEYEKQQAPF